VLVDRVNLIKPYRLGRTAGHLYSLSFSSRSCETVLRHDKTPEDGAPNWKQINVFQSRVQRKVWRYQGDLNT